MNECTGRRSRPRVRVGVAVVAAVVGVLTALALHGGGSPEQLDARFVAAVRADGHEVPHGAAGEATLVAAARKVCQRRDFHATVQERRRSALSSDELATVTQAFAGDARRFATLALDTYCS